MSVIAQMSGMRNEAMSLMVRSKANGEAKNGEQNI
jgi:hypothetical protein